MNTSIPAFGELRALREEATRQTAFLEAVLARLASLERTQHG